MIFFLGYLRLGASLLAGLKIHAAQTKLCIRPLAHRTSDHSKFSFFFFGSGTGLEPIFTLMARQLSNKNKNRAAPITRIGDLDPDLDVDADNLAAACGNQESLAVSRQHFKNAKWLKAKLAESSGAILYTFSQRIVFVCWLLFVWVTLII